MKGRARCIGWYIALGVFTNVAIAWGCVLLEPVDIMKGKAGTANAQGRSMRVIKWEQFGTTVIKFTARKDSDPIGSMGYLFRDDLPDWSELREDWSGSDDVLDIFVMENARGWPYRALVSYDRANRLRSSGWQPIQHDWGFALGPYGDLVEGHMGTRSLPLRPIWPGFLVNVVVHAGFAWSLINFPWTLVLVTPPELLRRWSRRKQGRCPICSYDLRGDLDAGCPECGWGRREAKMEVES